MIGPLHVLSEGTRDFGNVFVVLGAALAFVRDRITGRLERGLLTAGFMICFLAFLVEIAAWLA